MRAARLLRRAAFALAAGITLAAQAAPVHLFHASPEPYRFVDRAPYPAGEYFALHCAAGCALKKNRVTMKKVVLDTHDGRLPGVLARSGKAAPSLFMVRGLPGLKEGLVTTWYYHKAFQAGLPGAEQTWKASQLRRFDIGGKPLTVAGLYTNTKDEPCAADPDCLGGMRVEWKVRFGDIERTLAVAETNVPELGTPLTIDDVVVWIGDLDGDGKPDLVLRPQYRSDYLDLQLFLSRDLGPGKPWRPAAQFYYWDPDNQGC